MSKGPQPEQTFSMKIKDATHIKNQTDLQISIIDELLEDHYTSEKSKKLNNNLLSLLCEVLNVNFRLNNLVDQHLRESPREMREEHEEMLLNHTQMALIQTLTLSLYLINVELVQKENISLALH
mgnify:FL=1|jgi:hypothetical protein|tara:strand:+ start:3205 stop:3576 length:372 start_codon:yes stop_codon:yes gene_type:complete